MAVQAVLNAFLACMFTYTLTAAGGTSERPRWWRMWAVSGGGATLTAACTLAGCQIRRAAFGVYVFDTYGNTSKTAAVMATAVGRTYCD